MPHFLGNNKIVLQPNDLDVQYRFDFTACSTATANDGFLPFGAQIISVELKSTDEDKTTVSGIVQGSIIQHSGSSVVTTLSYPSDLSEGRYFLTFILTLDNGSVLEADFNRIEVIDR